MKLETLEDLKEYKEKRRKSALAKWQDKEYRAKTIAGKTGTHQTDEHKNNIRKALLGNKNALKKK